MLDELHLYPQHPYQLQEAVTQNHTLRLGSFTARLSTYAGVWPV